MIPANLVVLIVALAILGAGLIVAGAFLLFGLGTSLIVAGAILLAAAFLLRSGVRVDG